MDRQKLPFSVEDPVDHPISLYAATKKANELMRILIVIFTIFQLQLCVFLRYTVHGVVLIWPCGNLQSYFGR